MVFKGSRILEKLLVSSHSQQDVCCLMGDPIAGNPTQYMLEKAIAAGRLDWRFLTFKIPAIEFEGALRGARIFGFRGIMLAPPHCTSVLPYLEEVSEVARLSEQVNCIKQSKGRLIGDNTQGKALHHLVKQATDLSGTQITILGSGQAARVIAAELAASGAREICFLCPDPEAIEPFGKLLVESTLLEECNSKLLSSESSEVVSSDCRLLVNAISLEQRNGVEELPLQLASIPLETVVADLGYDPPQTWLLRGAKDLSCTTIDGLTILIEQTALAFETWTDAAADRQAMREAVEEFLVL